MKNDGFYLNFWISWILPILTYSRALLTYRSTYCLETHARANNPTSGIIHSPEVFAPQPSFSNVAFPNGTMTNHTLLIPDHTIIRFVIEVQNAYSTGCNKKNGPPPLQIQPLLAYFLGIFQQFDSHYALPPFTKQPTFDLFCQKFHKCCEKTV